MAYVNRGNALTQLKRPEDALASYDLALAHEPDHAEALSNRGNALLDLNRPEDALASCERALALKPDYAEALNNRGNALLDLNRPEDALASFDQALAIKLDHAKALNNRGNALLALERPDDALASYDKAIMIEPDNIDALGNLANAALQCCDWKRTREIAETMDQQVAVNRSIVSPFVMLSYSVDPMRQLNCACNYIRQLVPGRLMPLCRDIPYRHDKIRIAYLSGDFHAHATAHLTAQLFELHDRSRFEVVGIAYGVNDRSSERTRLEKAFDRFHDVSNLSMAILQNYCETQRSILLSTLKDLQGVADQLSSRSGRLPFR